MFVNLTETIIDNYSYCKTNESTLNLDVFTFCNITSARNYNNDCVCENMSRCRRTCVLLSPITALHSRQALRFGYSWLVPLHIGSNWNRQVRIVYGKDNNKAYEARLSVAGRKGVVFCKKSNPLPIGMPPLGKTLRRRPLEQSCNPFKNNYLSTTERFAAVGMHNTNRTFVESSSSFNLISIYRLVRVGLAFVTGSIAIFNVIPLARRYQYVYNNIRPSPSGLGPAPYLRSDSQQWRGLADNDVNLRPRDGSWWCLKTLEWNSEQ